MNVMTHSSDNNEYMEEVKEVNESESQSDPEPSMSEKRRKHRSRERQKMTLGGEIKYNELDYEKMNLITYKGMMFLDL